MSLIFKLKLFYASTILLCTIIFASVFYVEYIMEFTICSICVFERFSYLLTLVFASQIYVKHFNNINFSRKSITSMFYHVIRYNQIVCVIMIASILIASYHTALERGILQEEFLCVHERIINTVNISKEDFINRTLNQKMAPCDISPLKIQNVSLTELNLLASILIYIAYMATNFYIKEKFFNPSCICKEKQN